MIWTTCLGFCPARILKQSIPHFNKMRSPHAKNQLVITDNHYPLHREANKKELVELVIQEGAILIDSGGDLGAAQSFNNAVSQLPIRDQDYILGYDPDSWILTPYFDEAMQDVLDRHLDLAYVSATNPDVTFKNPEIIWEDRGDVKVIINRPEMFNVTMYRASWLKQIGGLGQLCRYYGFVESKLWPALKETGMKSGYLPGVTEDIRLTQLHDPEYTQWKSDQVSFKFESSFKEYLERHK